MNSPTSREGFPRPATGPRSPMSMTAWERQQLFREMVVQQLEYGDLSSRRRRLIIEYAACLDIDPLLAGRLIREAIQLHAERVDAAADCPQLRLVAEQETVRTMSVKAIMAIVIGAALIGSWVILSYPG